METWTLNVDSLFKTVGINKTGIVEMNDNTYDFDPENPKDSWLYPVFFGFKELKKQGFKAESFITIGTGSGVDSIGVYELFHPKEIYQVDVHPNVPDVADKNAKKLIGNKADIQTFAGDLCQPLIEKGIKANLVYANIPNIPSQEPVWNKKMSASRFMARDLEDCPEIFQKWMLSLQYLFLKQAKAILKPGGTVVDAIGARVPYELLEKLYTDNGFNVRELVSVYKIQSESEDVLQGYADAERDFGVSFDFYDHKKATSIWEGVENRKLSTPRLKNKLSSCRISASHAWEKFASTGEAPGHLCSILAGTYEN